MCIHPPPHIATIDIQVPTTEADHGYMDIQLNPLDDVVYVKFADAHVNTLLYGTMVANGPARGRLLLEFTHANPNATGDASEVLTNVSHAHVFFSFVTCLLLMY